MKQYLKIISCYFIVVILIVLVAEFFFFSGAHPDCAINDSVGPCEFVPRVSEYVFAVSGTLFPFLAIHLTYTLVKNRKSRRGSVN